MSARSPEPGTDQIVDLLRDSGDAAPHLDLDTATVIGQGSRVVRRRRVIAGAGVLAAATVLALGGYAALTGGGPLTTDLSPANPSVTTADPPPVDDVGLVRATLTVDATVAPSTGEAPMPAQNPLQVEVTLDTSATTDDLHVLVREDRGSGTTEHRALATSLRDGQITRIDVPELSLIVTVLPRSDWMTAVLPVPGGGSTGAQADLGETGLEVRVTRLVGVDDVESVAGFVRGDRRGQVFDEMGEQVLSGTTSDGDTYYLSERLDVLGFAGADGSGGSTWLSTRNRGERVVLSMWHGTGPQLETTVALLAHPGARDAAVAGMDGVDAMGSVPAEILTLGPDDTGWSLLHARYDSTRADLGARHEITWTDADGLIHAYHLDAVGPVGSVPVEAAAEVISDGTARVFLHRRGGDGSSPIGTIDLAPGEEGAWMNDDSGIYGVVRGEPREVRMDHSGTVVEPETFQLQVEDLWLIFADTVAAAEATPAEDVRITWTGPEGTSRSAVVPIIP